MKRLIEFMTLVVLVSGVSAQGPDPRSRQSRKEPAPERVTIFIEVEHIQLEKPDAKTREKIGRIKQRLESATGDEATKLSEQLDYVTTQSERRRGVLIAGRRSFWWDVDYHLRRARKTGWGLSRPQYTREHIGLRRVDQQVIVGVPANRARKLRSLQAGDFISLDVDRFWEASDAAKLQMPWTSGTRLFTARFPVKVIERPEWWPDAAVDWEPPWKDSDFRGLSQFDLALKSWRKQYKKRASGGRSYQIRVTLENKRSDAVIKAILWVRVLDADGDIAGGKRPLSGGVILKMNETKEVAVYVSEQVYERAVDILVGVDSYEVVQ